MPLGALAPSQKLLALSQIGTHSFGFSALEVIASPTRFSGQSPGGLLRHEGRVLAAFSERLFSPRNQNISVEVTVGVTASEMPDVPFVALRIAVSEQGTASA